MISADLPFGCEQIILEAQARPVPIMIAFIVGSWGIGVPTAYVLGLCQGRQWLMGVWIGMILGYLVTSAIGFYHAYFKTDWELQAQLAVERSKEKKTLEVDDVMEDTPLLLPK